MAIIGISGKIGSGKDTIGSIINYLTSGETGSYHAWLNNQTQEIGGKAISSKYKGKFEIKKFAGKLKQVISLLTGISLEDLEKQEVKDSVLGEEWNYPYIHQLTDERLEGVSETYTVRKLLQRVGTEAMRDKIHGNVWVNALFADYKPVRGCKEGDSNCIRKPDYCDNAEECDNKVYPGWVITDVRFPNEAEATKKRGGILIRVERYPKYIITYNSLGVSREILFDSNDKVHIDLLIGQSQREHPSENSLDGYDGFDYIVGNNSTIEFLVDVVKQILTERKLI